MKRYYPTPAQLAYEARRTDFTRASTITATLLLLLSLLSLLLPSCAARLDSPASETRAERMAPEPRGLHPATVPTYTTADRWEAPVPVDTVRGW